MPTTAGGNIFPARKSLQPQEGHSSGEGKLVRPRLGEFFLPGNVTSRGWRRSGAGKTGASSGWTSFPGRNFRPPAVVRIFWLRKSVPPAGGEVFRARKFHPPRVGNFSGSRNGCPTEGWTFFRREKAFLFESLLFRGGKMSVPFRCGRFRPEGRIAALLCLAIPRDFSTRHPRTRRPLRSRSRRIALRWTDVASASHQFRRRSPWIGEFRGEADALEPRALVEQWRADMAKGMGRADAVLAGTYDPPASVVKV